MTTPPNNTMNDQVANKFAAQKAYPDAIYLNSNQTICYSFTSLIEQSTYIYYSPTDTADCSEIGFGFFDEYNCTSGNCINFNNTVIKNGTYYSKTLIMEPSTIVIMKLTTHIMQMIKIKTIIRPSNTITAIIMTIQQMTTMEPMTIVIVLIITTTKLMFI